METGMLYKRTCKAKQSALIAVVMVITLLPYSGFSQTEKEYVFGVFRSPQLVNAQTTEMVKPKSWEFSIRHRFGMTGPDKSSYQQFLGLDLPANIRFGFVFPVTSRINIGAGRTKNDKSIDGEIKLLVIRQTEDNSAPVSVAAYFNAAVRTSDFPKVTPYDFFSDGVTPFSYKFNHRLSYCYEFICSRKFSEKFSMQISPSWIYKNLVAPGYKNGVVAIPVSCAYKTGLNSSLIFEYAYRFDNRPDNDVYPASIAWEIGTSGHIFQLVVSSNSELIEQENYTRVNYDYFNGYLALGFNIRRTFWSKKQHVRK